MPVCAKVISSWVRMVLNIPKADVSLGTLRGAAASAALVAGASLMSILQLGDWSRVSHPARHIYRMASVFCAAFCPEP